MMYFCLDTEQCFLSFNKETVNIYNGKHFTKTAINISIYLHDFLDIEIFRQNDKLLKNVGFKISAVSGPNKEKL